MDPRRQRSIMEAAVSVVVPKQIETELNESVEETTEEQAFVTIAENFISSVLGNELNESTEADAKAMIADLVEQTNIVCYAVNKYFGLQD
jgi:hypothetical protein